MPAAGQQTTVDGRTLRLTNLDKVLFAESGTTKGEMLAYYAEIAPLLLPQLRDRPVTRKRWPEGAGRGDGGRELVFFTKNLDSGTPDWVRRVRIEHSDRPLDYPVADDLATLTWLAQLAAIELHVPQWRFDAHDRPAHPDRLVLDLDPGPGVGLSECALVARSARDLLAQLDLSSVPVTSGSKGIHLYAALDGERSSDQVSRWAREIADALQQLHPDLVISSMRRSDRAGKVFLDWSQNNGAKTTIAPYSLRGRGRPWVAAPRTWEEVERPGLAQLELADVLARAATGEDPMAVLLTEPTQTPSHRSAVRPRTATASPPSPPETAPAGEATDQATDEPVDQPADEPVEDAGWSGLSPMLATSPGGRGDTFTERGDWEFELKWDGVRALVRAGSDGVNLRSRRGLEMAPSYPELERALQGLRAHDVVLDAEVVALDAQGRSSFGLLQQRINLSRPADVARVARTVPVQLICFDLLVLGRRRLLTDPYEQRRAALESLLADVIDLDPRIQAPPSLGTDFESALEVSRSLGSEGLVAKRLGSRYHPGSRSESWLKIKNVRTQEVVVVGWKAGQGSRGELGSLVMAVPDAGGVLRYAGRVGTGFSRRALTEAAALLADLETPDRPVADVPAADARGVTWLEPVLVAEVSYMDWTSTRRLRHPSWRGWRPDRSPADVVVEPDASGSEV